MAESAVAKRRWTRLFGALREGEAGSLLSTISLNHYLECTLQVFVFHTTQREETHKRLSIPPNGKLEAVPFTIRHQCRAAERNLFKERHFRKRAKEERQGEEGTRRGTELDPCKCVFRPEDPRCRPNVEQQQEEPSGSLTH